MRLRERRATTEPTWHRFTRVLAANKGRMVRLGLLGAAGMLVLGAAWFGFTVMTLPSVAELATRPPSSTAFMDRYLGQQEQRGQPGGLRWSWVPYDSISPHLRRAILVSEDINFFSHDGFDDQEISQALREAWEEKELPRGASTLTQQLARNLYLSSARTPWRKLKEALLTLRLERQLTKQRILEIYLNVVEFGPGLYGAEAASRHYFGVGASELDERQAAELAVVLPRPTVWHPGRTTPGYLAAVERVMRRMQKADFLWRLI